MFYSHEILTSKRYGVATVWLVATLGSKSTTKKVNRKAILEVNVKKACETIIQPEAPMALRLQSNLLYGVSRVYSEQCGYILADAQNAQNALRMLLRAVKQNDLDPNAGKAQPGQIMLMDDPAFMPDMLMPALDFDFSNLDLDSATLLETQGSEMSPRGHSRRASGASGASAAGSVLGIVIPSSDVDSYQLPRGDGFQLAGSSAHKMSGLGDLFPGEEEELIEDFDFEFDADGMMRDVDITERDRLQTDAGFPQLGYIGSDSGAAARVRLDHEEALTRQARGAAIQLDDDFIMQLDDDLPVMPDAEPFTPLGTAGPANAAQIESEASLFAGTVTSSISAAAPLQKRKRKVTKNITPDEQIELANSDLRAWQQGYLNNMDIALETRKMHRAPFIAKKNAFSWVLGNGIGDTGRGIGSSALPNPLIMYSGANLHAIITGIPAAIAPSRSPKRPRADNDDEDETNQGRRVRARSEANPDQAPQSGDQDVHLLFDESIPPEVGRDAPSALDDHASSAMPWNISASLHSFRNLASSSLPGGRNSILAGPRPGSRLTSASPLLGRGRTDSHLQQEMEMMELPDEEMDRSVGRLDLVARAGRDRGIDDRALAEEEFEMFGPAVEVDSQVVAGSQWVKEALARESMHFLEFVRNTLAEGDGELEHGEQDEYGQSDLGGRKEISFEILFPPQTNSMMVAAQAFHHVLSLATKSLLVVRQDEAFGDIWMGIGDGIRTGTGTRFPVV